MKKINFFILSAFVAMAGVFTGCTEDAAVSPSVELVAGSGLITGDVVVAPGAELKFKILVQEGDAKISSFTVTKEDVNLSGYPLLGKDVPSVSFDITANAPNNIGAYTYAFIATDKDGNTGDVSVKVTVGDDPNANTPLSSGTDITLIYVNKSQTNGKNINETLGVKYSGNVDATTGTIEVLASKGNKFVMLDKAAFDAIKTQQALTAKYSELASTGTDKFTAKSDANFSAKYFMTKVSDVVYLVHMSNLKFAEGNNQAFFTYFK